MQQLAGDKLYMIQRHRLLGSPHRSHERRALRRAFCGRQRAALLQDIHRVDRYCCAVLSSTNAWLTLTVLACGRRAGEQRGPCVLVVRERGGAVFGCFTAEAWRVAPRYYGTGESFVFQLQVL